MQTVHKFADQNGDGVLDDAEIAKITESLGSASGSIGNVLQNIVANAVEAVRMMPRATLAEQVSKATELNVFSTMAKVMEYSDIVRQLVRTGEVQVHGSVYDIFTGQVGQPQVQGARGAGR